MRFRRVPSTNSHRRLLRLSFPAVKRRHHHSPLSSCTTSAVLQRKSHCRRRRLAYARNTSWPKSLPLGSPGQPLTESFTVNGHEPCPRTWGPTLYPAVIQTYWDLTTTNKLLRPMAPTPRGCSD